MKRVLIHTLIFSPDGVSTAYLYNDIALRLQQRGYEVVVLATTPHFNIDPEQFSYNSESSLKRCYTTRLSLTV